MKKTLLIATISLITSFSQASKQTDRVFDVLGSSLKNAQLTNNSVKIDGNLVDIKTLNKTSGTCSLTITETTMTLVSKSSSGMTVISAAMSDLAEIDESEDSILVGAVKKSEQGDITKLNGIIIGKDKKTGIAYAHGRVMHSFSSATDLSDKELDTIHRATSANDVEINCGL